jgi:hypothetical protein
VADQFEGESEEALDGLDLSEDVIVLEFGEEVSALAAFVAEDVTALHQYYTLLLYESPERSNHTFAIEGQVSLVDLFEAVERGELQVADFFSEVPFLDDAAWAMSYRSMMMRFLRR